MVPVSDDPRRFNAGSRLLHEDGRALVVAGSRRHGDRLLVTFAGYEDRSAADSLRGTLYVPASDVRDLDDDEYWPHELVGLVVTDTAGTRLGTVSEVRPAPAQDLLVVDTAAGERYVPMVAAIVTRVDLSAGRVVIDPPPGLLD